MAALIFYGLNAYGLKIRAQPCYKGKLIPV